MEPSYDDAKTINALSALQPHQQIAFGAASAERMMPNYETFMREVGWGNIDPLRHALDVVWDAAAGARPNPEGLSALLSKCEQCAPDSEDFTSLYTASAQDAVFAICALLDFLLDPDLERISSAPRFSTDSVDLVIQEQGSMDPQDPLLERKILEHPLMQQELLRQKRDLADVAKLPAGNRTALEALRRRVQRESNLRLGP